MTHKNLYHDQSGTSAVEFAVVLPLLLTLVMGAIEFGTLYYDKHMITNASREAARAGIVQETPRVPIGTITAVATSYLTAGGNSLLINYVNTAAAPVATVPVGPCVNWQDPLTVTVTYPYNYLFLDSIPGINPVVILSATTTMVCE